VLLQSPPNLERKPNTVTILSMSKKSKIPPCDIYIDVSSFMVDDWDFRYKGTEPIIQNTLYNHHGEFFEQLSLLLFTMNVESGLVVVLVCEAGERRSVAAAELLAREIQWYPKVEVYHKELMKWFKF
jgi:RNase adaptor protein for sRNA GlmZ degradation